MLSTDPDTLFPIRAALAYDVAKRVVTGPQTLLVDRPSDVLYLKWFSRELQLQGRAHLAPAWSLVPVGGLDSIAPFVALFAGQEQQIAVLTDGLMSHPRRLDGLWERGMLQFGRILRPGAVHRPRGRAARGPRSAGPLPRARDGRLRPRGVGGARRGARLPTRQRLVAEVEAYFASMPPWAPRFDSFAPASYLFENTATLRATLPDLDAGPRPVRKALPRSAQPRRCSSPWS